VQGSRVAVQILRARTTKLPVGMSSGAFCRYELRTTDPDAARSFYAELLGAGFAARLLPGQPSTLSVGFLPDPARARGAPAHWLGHIGVSDVDAAVRRLVELGSDRLGPTSRASDGTPFAALRDPSGAVVAVRESAAKPQGVPPVAWHHLHTTDADRAFSVYSELFGWTHTETLDVPDLAGGYRMFAWDGAGRTVGSIANTARRPGVHTHWLFYFPVASLDEASGKVQQLGGLVLPQTELPDGTRLTPCDDPQGAAFGLLQRGTAASR
jgi:predicted enzyme related to lactoylglutathione lyase